MIALSACTVLLCCCSAFDAKWYDITRPCNIPVTCFGCCAVRAAVPQLRFALLLLGAGSSGTAIGLGAAAYGLTAIAERSCGPRYQLAWSLETHVQQSKARSRPHYEWPSA